MTLQGSNVPQPPSFWSSRTRRRAAIVSIVVTIVGIYLNVSINYANFISARARMAADTIQALNIAYGSTVAANGKSCIKLANSEFQRIPDEKAKLIVTAMWNDSGNEKDER